MRKQLQDKQAQYLLTTEQAIEVVDRVADFKGVFASKDYFDVLQVALDPSGKQRNCVKKGNPKYMPGIIGGQGQDARTRARTIKHFLKEKAGILKNSVGSRSCASCSATFAKGSVVFSEKGAIQQCAQCARELPFCSSSALELLQLRDKEGFDMGESKLVAVVARSHVVDLQALVEEECPEGQTGEAAIQHLMILPAVKCTSC